MFTHNIDSVLFKVGFLEIRYYGLAYAIGFLIAYFVLLNVAKKKLIENFDEKKADLLITYLIVGMLVGARIFFFLFSEPSIFFTDPLELFRIWNGGMSFHGALTGMILALYFFSKNHKTNFLKLADALSIPGALGLFLGRLANFANAELYGQITGVPWCVNFPTAEGCRHPYQIYAALSHLFTFSILFFMNKKKHKEGHIFYNFLLLYGAFRFITDFFRADERILLNMSGGQILSLVMVAVGAYFLYKDRFIKLHPVKKQ